MSVWLLSIVLAAPDQATVTAMQQGRFADATTVLMAKRKTGVWDLEDQMMLAAACLGSQDLACAEHLYNETLQPTPRTALAYYGLGVVAQMRGQNRRAAQYFTAYLSSTLPGRVPAYDAVATNYLQTPQKPAPRRLAVGPPPGLAELSYVSARWAGMAFLPALLMGSLAFAVVEESTGADGAGVLVGFAVGAGTFGGITAYGIDRAARRRGYVGSPLRAGMAAVGAPILALGGVGMLAVSGSVGNSILDDDLIGLVAFAGGGLAISVLPALAYRSELRVLGAPSDAAAEVAAPSVVLP
jgi:hypothetical protein